jgi:hypothetical protein
VAKPPIPAPGQLELVRPPAPGRLELVRSFLNTRNVEQGTDALATPAALSAWLRENDLVARKAKLALTPSDVEYVRGIREDVRALTQRNNGADCACLTASLEAASERSRYALVLDPATNTCVLRPTADGVARAHPCGRSSCDARSILGTAEIVRRRGLPVDVLRSFEKWL